MPYPIKNLIEGQTNITTVQSDDNVQHAIKLMSKKDFSQLPVIDKSGHAVGIVSYYFVT